MEITYTLLNQIFLNLKIGTFVFLNINNHFFCGTSSEKIMVCCLTLHATIMTYDGFLTKLCTIITRSHSHQIIVLVFNLSENYNKVQNILQILNQCEN